MAYRLGKLSLLLTANDTERFKPRPTITSRMLGLTWTAIYDAWTRYDTTGNTIYLAAVRRPIAEFTEKNKEIAILHAAYGTMREYYFSDSLYIDSVMTSMGIDVHDHNLSPLNPAGIGNMAARAVIEARKQDGANQYGDMTGSDGSQYSDYTGYKPLNTVDRSTSLMRWQPKYFIDNKGKKYAPSCLTPQWGKVKTLLIDSSSQFRSPAPPAKDSPQLKAEVKEVVGLQSKLTDEQRALVEFMRDGPKSVQQAGHWLIFAQDVSLRHQHTLDYDVIMYFLVEAAAMDAFIACWDTKMFYDYARPYALVHHYFENQNIEGWSGPLKGRTKLKGQQWRPYSPEAFLCPPFPSYVSGHSTVSGACSEILRLFTGADTFGSEVKRVPGAMTETNRLGDTVTLKFPTFTNAADQAGMSRVLGGYHIQVDNVEGLKLGRSIGKAVWKRYLQIYR